MKNSNKKENGETIFPVLPKVKENEISTYIIVFLIIFIFYFTGLGDWVLSQFNIPTNSNIIYYINIIISLIIIITLIITLKGDLKRDTKYYFKHFKQYIKYGLSTLFVCYILQIISTAFISPFITNIEQSIENERITLYFAVQAILFAPIMEECMFRGLIKKVIKNKYAFLIISSVFFGAMHILPYATSITELWLIIPYSIAGFALAYNYEKTGNLTSSIVLHMISNSISLFIL